MVKIASCSYHYAITSRLDLLLRSLIRSGSSLSYTVGHVWAPYLSKSTVDRQSQNLCKITWYDVWWNWILLNQRQHIPLILVIHVIAFVIRLGDFRNRATTTLLVAWASAASLPCMATTTGPDAMTSAENYHMESRFHAISKFGILNLLSRGSFLISSGEAFKMFMLGILYRCCMEFGRASLQDFNAADSFEARSVLHLFATEPCLYAWNNARGWWKLDVKCNKSHWHIRQLERVEMNNVFL